jgi:acetoin utilization protein AcuB
MMKVRDIMRPARWTIGPDDSLGRAERIMAHRRLHQLAVVDSGALAGLLSERDILDYRASAKTDEDWWRVPVRRAMEGIPATATPEDTVASAIDRLAKSPVDVLPIVEHGFLIGEITATDLFEAERIPSEPSPQPITAADAMTAPAVSVRPTDSLFEAARLMVDHQVRHLPVVEDGAVVGMLSDRDIRTVAGDPVRFVEAREGEGAQMLNVRDAMAPTALTIHANRLLRDVANELVDENVGALPVVDADGKLIGIVSYVDALRALSA